MPDHACKFAAKILQRAAVFLAFLREVLGPQLRPGQVLIMDKPKVFHMCWPLSDGSSKFILIDEQPNHQIVHAVRLGKAQRATNQPLDPGPD